MKKIISTILVISIIICTNACRPEEENLVNLTSDGMTSNNIFKKNNDSIKTDSIQTATTPLPVDPPPKNGHQW